MEMRRVITIVGRVFHSKHQCCAIILRGERNINLLSVTTAKALKKALEIAVA